MPDLALLGVGGARLWSDWAIHRLERLPAGDVDQLIAEIGGSVFYQGTLDTRFEQVGLDELPPLDQRRIGVAVARRARGGTFMVSIPGLRTAAESPSSFPTPYRAGLVEGCLLTADAPASDKYPEPRISRRHDRQGRMGVDRRRGNCRSLVARVDEQPIDRHETARAMDGLHGGVSRPHQPGWKDLADAVRCAF